MKSDDLDDIVNLENVAFDYGIGDVNSPTQLGMAFVWCSVNEHVLDEENKAAGTLALDFILTHNRHYLTVPIDDPAIIDIFTASTARDPVQ